MSGLSNKTKATVLGVVLATASAAANAGLIVNGDSTVTIGASSTLNLNCGDIELNDTSSLVINGGSIVNRGAQTTATNATFTNNGGSIDSCRPIFSKSFSPSSFTENAVTTLTYIIDNKTGSAASAISFSEDFANATPVNSIEIASPANAVTNCASGSLTATPGSSVVNLSGATLAANSSCTVSVDVTGSTDGVISTISGALTSSLGDSGTATASVEIIDPAVMAMMPTMSKQYSPTTIGLNSASTITYTIVNPNPSTPVQNLTINETLPTNLVLATEVGNGSTDCPVKAGDTASITGTSGAGSFAFSGYSLSAGESCQISVSVTSGTAATYTSPSASLFSDFTKP